MKRCDILFSNEHIGPKDKDGCYLPRGHAEPHEFVADDGDVIQWETDLECDCDHCMRCEGDYCTTYWRKDSAPQQEV